MNAIRKEHCHKGPRAHCLSGHACSAALNVSYRIYSPSARLALIMSYLFTLTQPETYHIVYIFTLSPFVVSYCIFHPPPVPPPHKERTMPSPGKNLLLPPPPSPPPPPPPPPQQQQQQQLTLSDQGKFLTKEKSSTTAAAPPQPPQQELPQQTPSDPLRTQGWLGRPSRDPDPNR